MGKSTKNQLLLIVIVGIFLLIWFLTKKVNQLFAYNSGLVSPTIQVGDWVDGTNVFIDDDDYAYIDASGSPVNLYHRFYGFVPAYGLVPDRIDLNIKVQVNNTNCGRSISYRLTYDGTDSANPLVDEYSSPEWDDTQWKYKTLSLDREDDSEEWDSIVSSEGIDEDFGVSLMFSTGACNIQLRLDWLQAVFYVGEEVAEIVNVTVDGTDGWIDLEIVGGTDSCDDNCSVSVGEVCTSDTEPRLEHLVWGPSNLAIEDSAWCSEDNTNFNFHAIVPLEHGYDCGYVLGTICTDGSGDVTFYEQTSLGDPTETQNLPEVETCIASWTNVEGWMCVFRQTMIKLWVPKNIDKNFNLVKDRLKNKAPFSYAFAVSNLDFEYDEQTNPILGTIELDVGEIEGQEWDIDLSVFSSFLSTIKSALSIIIWMNFVVFLFNFARIHKL